MTCPNIRITNPLCYCDGKPWDDDELEKRRHHAVSDENYELAQDIKDEQDRRKKSGTIVKSNFQRCGCGAKMDINNGTFIRKECSGPDYFYCDKCGEKSKRL